MSSPTAAMPRSSSSKRIELLLQRGMEALVLRRAEQLAGGVVMPFPQPLRELERPLAVAASGRLAPWPEAGR